MLPGELEEARPYRVNSCSCFKRGKAVYGAIAIFSKQQVGQCFKPQFLIVGLLGLLFVLLIPSQFSKDCNIFCSIYLVFFFLRSENKDKQNTR